MSTGTITIENIRSIKRLEFELPATGCYLIAGANGSGKTSLLAALHRIGSSQAFRIGFPTPPDASIIDAMAGATVTYSVGGKRVTYIYRGARWVPNPREDALVLSNFGYTEVQFFRADKGRMEPTQKDIRSGRLQLVHKDIRDALEKIFEDKRFDGLGLLSTGRGRSRPAYLVREKKGVNRFFSEKHFSLGEMCIIRLVEQLLGVPGGALLLVDELEMALHPRIQIRLLDFLRETARQKNLTILVATHSATMIRVAGPDSIYYLSPDPMDRGQIECVHPCFPARATAGIAYAEEVDPEFIFLVEDTRAAALLNALIDRYKDIDGDRISHRIYKTMPIGGYVQVLEFHRSSQNYLFSKKTRIVSFLDADVEEVLRKIVRDPEGAVRLKENVALVKRSIFYLPCTPEPGFIDFIEGDRYARCAALDERFSGVSTIQILESQNYVVAADAKGKLRVLIGELREKTNLEESQVEKKLFSFFVKSSFSDGQIRQILGPAFASA